MNFKKNIGGPIIKASGLYKYFGYTPMTQFQENDVFVAGFPKSGNTWMKHLMTGVMYNVTMGEVSNRLVRELTPDVHFFPFYKRYSNEMCFKTHYLPLSDHKRVIYIVRDGRDAMVSYYHMLRNMNQKADLEAMIKTGQSLFPCKWHQHVRAWIDNPFEADIHYLRYEDLRATTRDELRKICTFLELDRSDSMLDAIIKNCSFENMRKKEASGMWDKKKGWRADGHFIRKGQSGDFEKELSPELTDFFNKEAAAELQHFNY